MGNSATQFELAINANAITLGYLAECGDAILADPVLVRGPEAVASRSTQSARRRAGCRLSATRPAAAAASLPVDGFFEWKAVRGQRAKQPYAIANALLTLMRQGWSQENPWPSRSPQSHLEIEKSTLTAAPT
jgi:hypothetical protein